MSTRFRVNAIEIHTDALDSPSIRRFPHPLTVLTGPAGTGKSTVFELLRFALGMRHQTTPVMDRVQSVTVDLTLVDRRLHLNRQRKSDTVTVHEGRRQVGAYPTASENRPSIGTKLMEWMGLPADMTTLASKGPRPITFEHVWDFLHVAQPEIDRSIARNDSSATEGRRKRVFELLFGLIDPERPVLEGELKNAKDALREVQKEHKAIVGFVRSARRRDHAALLSDRARLEEEKQRLTEERNALRAQTAVTDDRVIALRRLLADVRRREQRTREALEALQLAQENRRAQLDHLDHVANRLDMQRDAGRRLADIEFTRCPRCMQHLPEGRADEGTCPLCLQPEPGNDSRPRNRRRGRTPGHGTVPLPLTIDPTAQLRQLEQQQEEIRMLLRRGQREQELLDSNLRELGSEAARLNTEIDELSRNITNPRTDALTSVAERLAQVTEKLRNDEEELLLWRGITELENKGLDRERIVGELHQRKEELERRDQTEKLATVAELSGRYENLLADIGMPNVGHAYIGAEDYLPYIDGKKFDKISIGGGTRTVFIVAYWLTLLEFSLERPDRRFPAFLLLDSPQKSLGPHDQLSRKLYERLAGITDSHGDQVQIIVLDSELPEGFAAPPGYERIDYDNPGIRGIPLHYPE